MENKGISIIIFGKPKAFEIYELFENGRIKNIETENKGPDFLPVSTSENIYHFYSEKGNYYYEVYSEAFANNANRAGNLIGVCIKSKNKIRVNKSFIDNLNSNFQDIKSASLENSTFIYSNLLSDFINKIKIEKFVSDIISDINSLDTQGKSFSTKETLLIENGNTEISNIQLDIDKYEYYISSSDSIFKNAINAQKYVELKEKIFVIENGMIVPKQETIVNTTDNSLSINSLFNQISKTNDEKKRRELIKKLQDELFFEKQKVKRRSLIILLICALFAIGGVAFGWYSNKVTTKIESQDTEITDLSEAKEQLANEKAELEKQKGKLNIDIANKQQELKNLEKQAKGTEADLRKQLSELNQKLATATVDSDNYKKTYTISNDDLNNKYIPNSKISEYIKKDEYNRVKNENDSLRDENQKVKSENEKLKKESNKPTSNSQTNVPKIDDSSIKHPPFRLQEGASHTLEIKNKGTRSLTWESADSNIATIDKNGKIQAKKTGAVEIRLKEGDTIIGKITLDVTPKS